MTAVSCLRIWANGPFIGVAVRELTDRELSVAMRTFRKIQRASNGVAMDESIL